jgi:hypothetical protein
MYASLNTGPAWHLAEQGTGTKKTNKKRMECHSKTSNHRNLKCYQRWVIKLKSINGNQLKDKGQGGRGGRWRAKLKKIKYKRKEWYLSNTKQVSQQLFVTINQYMDTWSLESINIRKMAWKLQTRFDGVFTYILET